MTKSLKVKILAVLLTVLLAMGGLFLANTTKVSASSITTDGNVLNVTSFVVHEGASVRLGDGTSAQMGIKFAAELSKSEYQALKVDYENVQYGIFIMPKAYETAEGFGPINYENCFGEGKIYYSPDEYVEGVGHKIHNIQTVPKYVAEENGYNGYLVQGSIVNILPENLNVELVGVAYIKAEKNDQTYYAFAKNAHDNVRTVVQVAQNMLEKEGFDCDGNDVVQGYVSTFLSNYEAENGAPFQASYNAEFYVMNSAGEFVLDASKTTVVSGVEFPSSDIAKTVEAKSAPAHDGYIALNGLNGAFDENNEFVYDAKLLKIDGSTTLKFKYQEDKGNIFFNTSMQNGNFGWSPATFEASTEWSMSGDSSLFFASASEQNLYYGTGLSSTASKNEDGSYKYGTENTGRNGWKLSNVYFPTTTSKISFWYVNLGTASGSIQLTFNAANDGLDKTTKYTRTLGTTKTPRKVEIDVGKEIGSINHMIIYCTANVYLDNMAWEKDLYVEQTLVKADTATSANLGNLKANVKSTKYSASELANVEVSNVVAKAISTGTTAVANDGVLEASNGSYVLPVEDKGYYEYTATFTLGESSIDGKGFVRSANGIYGFASFAKYTGGNGNIWYDGVKGDYSTYIQDQTVADLGLLHMSSADYTYTKNGVINGSIYKMGVDGDGYSLRVYPGRTNWTSGAIFYLTYYRRWQSSSSLATSMSFPKADNNTMVCFFVYNPTAQVINLDGLYKHSYIGATIVDASGTALSGTTKSFSLGELQPGWNYVEHDFVAANASLGAANLTGLATRVEFAVTSTVTCYYAPTMLFDTYAVR